MFTRFKYEYLSQPMSGVIEVRGAADFHVHLRQGTLSSLVTPHVRKGGFNLAYVMVGKSKSLSISARLTFSAS